MSQTSHRSHISHRSHTSHRSLAAALVLALAAAFAPRPARAADYGYFIDVETEDQLLDLLSNQEIDEGSYAALQDLLNDGVDLNTADREELYALPNLTYEEVDKIIAYRQLAGPITDPVTLVSSGILTERKLLALAAFLLSDDGGRRVDLRGRLRYRSAYVLGDDKAPPMWLGARVSTLKKKLELGLIGVLTRNELGEVRWDPNRDALSATAPSVRLRVPKLFAQYQTQRFHVIAGTYRIGFGQRLVVDNTNRYNPNGIRVDDQIYYSRDLTRQCREAEGELNDFVCSLDGGTDYEAPDFRWPIRFRGVAAGLRTPETKDGWFQLYGFGSYQTRNLYQYELYDRSRCPDPRDDADPDCSAPPVYRTQVDPLAPTTRYGFSTLPDLFNELSFGGNLTWFFNRRTHIGMTGFGATVDWLPEGANIDFQEWARWPFAGPFGAIGVDAAWGWRWLDVFVEAARSFDKQPEGGGFAGIARSTITLPRNEIEISARYYDPNYNNPYARPISAVDEFEGLRAANEAGVRLRHIGQIGDLELRTLLDVWWNVADNIPQLRFRSRAEYEVTPWFRPAVWIDVFDKNLDESGRGQCFSTPFETVEGEPIPCAGTRAQLGAQLKLIPRRGLSFTLRYLHRIQDDRKYPDGFRQDLNAWATIAWAPVDWLTLRLRVRYLDEDIADPGALETSIWTYVESIFVVRRQLRAKLRYEVYAFIDDRKTTAERNPNPSHWLRLELEYRF